MVMSDSSSNRIGVTFVLPTSDMTRGSRVVARMVLPTCLTTLVCLLMSRGGRTEFGESISTGSTMFTVFIREHVLMSTSSLIPRDVPKKPLMKVSPDPLVTTVET